MTDLQKAIKELYELYNRGHPARNGLEGLDLLYRLNFNLMEAIDLLTCSHPTKLELIRFIINTIPTPALTEWTKNATPNAMDWLLRDLSR